jgi:ketosteroid isomerase-like protein
MTTEVRTQYKSLLTAFGEGWSAGDSVKIGALFAEDAVFVPDPFSAEIRGRAAIEAYWKDIPFEQSEVAFRFGEIYVIGPWFSAEFKCTFRRRRMGEPVDVRGAIFCETAEGLIGEMRMYYHRDVGGS